VPFGVMVIDPPQIRDHNVDQQTLKICGFQKLFSLAHPTQ